MAFQLHNTLTRGTEPFVPLDSAGRRVGLYCCGPTVYDFGHIGNFRTFVFADLVRRFLEYRGYAVCHVMNITDVEDKIIARVRQTGMSLHDYTRQYEEAFLADSRTLNLLPPHHRPRATEFIPDILALIERLVARGLAYQAGDRSVYFSIEKYRAAGRRYGTLVRLNFDEMRVGERVKNDEYTKEALADFALWKARVPEDGDVFWPSPWGEGRPGWHIECSAMSMKLLGPSFDLHLGGEDLIFPHHEDEIAQSEGAGLQIPGQPFVKYWLHGAHLQVEGRKMAKSLGNFFTLRDLLGRGFTGREIRYLLLTAHYRETFNFTLEGLAGARAALGRIDECLAKLREHAGPNPPSAAPEPGLVERFGAALDDDLNISAAWAAVFDWVRDQNRLLAQAALNPAAAAAALAAWDRIDTVLGVGAAAAEADAPAGMLALLEARQAARKDRDFARADALRQELLTHGWIVEDTPKGSRLKRAR
ncbi:MAG TPA: cysteine--tRNA ligase [Verrucomicrobiota bacterium]|nr:cysteine--tRNA ligase [Verrucomicrobiota bacterium]HNU49832.1 cysteine--tRNA ligase [Verrucomicrobiota bacterium]